MLRYVLRTTLHKSPSMAALGSKAMTIVLRITCCLYLVTAGVAIAFMFFLQPELPPEAIAYLQWFYTQPQPAALTAVLDIGMLLIGASWLSAAALSVNQRWARWPFVVSAVAIIAINLVVLWTLPPPQLYSAINLVLNEINSVLVGAISILAFLPRERV